MLVYANHLEIVGKNPALQVLRAVSGWLSEKLDQRLIISDVTKPGEISGGQPPAWLRTDAADGSGFKLYSWILKHPDAAISGRQWVTELGLKEDGAGSAEFSCVVQTEEQSILVSESVEASRPRVVRFVFDNVENEAGVQFSRETIGATLRWVGENVDSYRGLLADIEAMARGYPIVVVSPNNDGTYAVDPTRLQKTLFGLAQVVGVHRDYDSYAMEEALGRKYSAWAGAINIIRMAHRDGSVYSSLISPRDIPASCTNAHKKECLILGRVSHNTNVPKQRNRIRPEGVRTLAIRSRLQQRLSDLLAKPDSPIHGELEMVYEEMEALTEQLSQSQLTKDVVELTLLEREERIQEMEKQLKVRDYERHERGSPVEKTLEQEIILEELFSMASVAQPPSPAQCLHMLERVYPQKVSILPAAFESARGVNSFQQGRRLLDMLHRLVFEYLPQYLESGDATARNVFTNKEFAARESDTVTRNNDYMKYRRFEYNAEEIEMSKHLKVGVADDSTQTIRVHFEVDQDEGKIVIGHCGRHLPLPGR